MLLAAAPKQHPAILVALVADQAAVLKWLLAILAALLLDADQAAALKWLPATHVQQLLDVTADADVDRSVAAVCFPRFSRARRSLAAMKAPAMLVPLLAAPAPHRLPHHRLLQLQLQLQVLQLQLSIQVLT